MKVLSIVGARPQFVKLGVICRAIAAAAPDVHHTILHTGQHYDYAMSEVFFRELGIPEPNFNLAIGSGRHGAQTGAMLAGTEEALLAEMPDWVLVYGDTNSTLAGALAAAKLHLPVAHVEAGLRSFNRRMPEEINRVIADHVSTLLLCPSRVALENLEREGLGTRAVWTGDVMLDAVLHARELALSQPLPASLDGFIGGQYALATLHRAENTGDLPRLMRIVTALDHVAKDICPVRFCVHPRTRKALTDAGWTPRHLMLHDPLSYLDMMRALSNSRFVLTDSGGLQKEAYFLSVPCITLRDETEWLETMKNGCNVLAGDSELAISQASAAVSAAGPWEAPYGTGQAGVAVLQALRDHVVPAETVILNSKI